MTGAERLQQVREALLVPAPSRLRVDAHAALDGCVLLTAEEASRIRTALRHSMPLQYPSFATVDRDEALALLGGKP